MAAAAAAADAACVVDCDRGPEGGLCWVGEVGAGLAFEVEYDTRAASIEVADGP